MVTARPSVERIAAVRHVSRDDDQIAGAEQVLLAAADAEGLSFNDRADGELRVTAALIGLAALPCAAQLRARQAGR